MQELLNYTIFGNTVLKYFIALAIFLVGITVVYVFKKYILSRLKKISAKTQTNIDDLLVKAIEKSLIPIIYFGIFYAALYTLKLSQDFVTGLNFATKIIITFFIVKTIISAIGFAFKSYAQKSEDSDRREKQLRSINGLANLVIWIIALLFLLDNIGVQISAVIAGLGIGGIAVALAAQAVLGDLFSYFVIFFDRPFEIGDFIIVGDKVGAVEKIGIKTTRIRAIGGEILIFSNTDLTNSRVHNYKKMERRRVVFKLGVTYQTTAQKLKLVPQIVKQIIEQQTDATFDRGHFLSYGDFSLNFEFVYYVAGADYNKYMDIQQAINLTIYEAFEKEGIEFAYPTQTLYLNKIKSDA
jgi:small-conductance mechanosensitive channel